MTLMAALLIGTIGAFAHAQDASPVSAVPVSIVTSDSVIVTSAGQQRLCGYLANDPTKQTVCYPDKVGVPYDSTDPKASIAVTSGMFCTYSPRGVVCQGQTSYNELFEIPRLSNVFALALPPFSGGGIDACALTRDVSGDSRAVCWGGAEKVTAVPAELKSPTAIATNGSDACALGANGYVKCWGSGEIGDSPYGIRDLKKLIVGSHAACAVDVYGLMCWGPKGEVPADLAADGFVKDVAIISTQICALTNEHQLRCFGDEPYALPELVKPIAITSMGQSFCATDIDGLKCWGHAYEIPKSTSNEVRLPFPPGRQPRPGNCIDP